MTDILQHITLVDRLIYSEQTFALYKIPAAQEPKLIMANDRHPVVFDSIQQLNGCEGFVFAPFHITDNHPLLLIRPDHVKEGWNAILNHLKQYAATPAKELLSIATPDIKKEKANYQEAFKRFIEGLQATRFTKLVLSRSTVINRNTGFSPAEAFLRACEKYPNAFIYLCFTPLSRLWMGSSPEVLLTGGNQAYQTVALAGTRKAKTDQSTATRWDSKNKNEQLFVADYLREVLTRCTTGWKDEKTETLTAGNVVHLKTGFSFTYPDSQTLGNLLEELHPTPAVCGLPKREAYSFILENEGYDREYYSGFTGYLSATNQTDLYVNLRCMKIGNRQLTLFSGGGLLASSTRETEWKETEEKLKTMREIIQ